VEAVGPGVFGVEAAGDFVEGEVGSGTPALFFELAAELFGVAYVALAFGGADVEPDAGARVVGRIEVADEGEDTALIPPEGGGEDAEAAERFRVFEAEIEADEAAEGGAAEAGVFRAGEGAVGDIDEGDKFFEDEAAVAVAFASAHFEVAGGGVLGHAAKAGVGDADEDGGGDAAGVGEPVGGGAGAPGVAGDVGGSVVKEILAVVEVEDGEAAVGLGGVLGREVDGDAAEVWMGKDGGVEVEGFETGAGGLAVVVALEVRGVLGRDGFIG
jgi:hypothetical protein